MSLIVSTKQQNRTWCHVEVQTDMLKAPRVSADNDGVCGQPAAGREDGVDLSEDLAQQWTVSATSMLKLRVNYKNNFN